MKENQERMITYEKNKIDEAFALLIQKKTEEANKILEDQIKEDIKKSPFKMDRNKKKDTYSQRGIAFSRFRK